MIKDFEALKISLASPQQVLSWSHGEVKKAETINYRTQKAELDGLMCEKIFGPTKNYECYCGKYKKIRYKGIICDKCGVEVTNKRVRRERMGHIKLATQVVHVWFAFGAPPNKLATILNIPQKKLESVIYFARYLVLSVDNDKKLAAKEDLEKKLMLEVSKLEEELEKELAVVEKKNEKNIKKLTKDEKQTLKAKSLENEYKKGLAKTRELFAKKEERIRAQFNEVFELINEVVENNAISEEQHNSLVDSGLSFCEVGMGAEAILSQLKKVDLAKEEENIKTDLDKTKSVAKRTKLTQRLRIISGIRKNNIDPEWIVMPVVPVIPPDLRPIIQLPGGRFATSDLNDLYRRVINRNNRLKRLMDLGAPEIILRNEKRMLQEAVDALIDNSHRPGKPILNSREHPYKSLADMLRGKQGRFRANLLGKRVDYSGRAVIVAGPDLGIYQCGIPKVMALELFKPFVIHEIITRGLAPNIKSAKNYLEEGSSEVWDILEEVIKGRPVMLNRAPTLHKQGIQALYPVLTEGNAIRLHPLLCTGFNADFDGDQMAVHVPISQKAVDEAVEKMMPDSNMLLLRDGSTVISVSKDMAYGCYHLTGAEDDVKEKDTPSFSSPKETFGAYETDRITLRQLIRVMVDGEMVLTTVGRLIFNEALPDGYPYQNNQIQKGAVSSIAADVYEKYGAKVAVEVLDNLKNLGFEYGTKSGFSVGMEDLPVTEARDKALEDIDKQLEKLNSDYYNGLITLEEQKSLAEDLWMRVSEEVAEATEEEYKGGYVYSLEDSGAYPVRNPVRQIAAIRGLILDPQGKIVELPLRSNYKLGLTPLEYFVAARGTRKGLTDVALKTSGSGYLTRKLVDVAQDVIVREEDCGTSHGIVYRESDNRRLSFEERITGRFTAEKVVDEKSGEVVVKKSGEITKEKAKEVVDAGITTLTVRSPLTCESREGICQKCYGYNPGTRRLVEVGTAVGVIAAQAMGEAATQLTLDSKHRAGAASEEDITQGLPRVEELFEARVPKGKALLSDLDGKVEIVKDDDENPIQLTIRDVAKVTKEYKLKKGDTPEMKKSKKLKKGDVIYTTKSGRKIKVTTPGQATVKDGVIIFEGGEVKEKVYKLELSDEVIVGDGDRVHTGQSLTAGSIDPKEILKLSTLEEAQTYLIDNVQQTYGLQGIAIKDVHVEVIVKRMTGFVKIKKNGDSDFLPGDFALYTDVIYLNKELKEQAKDLITFDRTLMGITASSINTPSFLSAASFQEVVKVLSDAALVGKVDNLRGLKENVIIGRPVPLGKHLR